MTGQKDVKHFLLPDTPSQDLIWAKFEEIAPNPSEGDALPLLNWQLGPNSMWVGLCMEADIFIGSLSSRGVGLI